VNNGRTGSIPVRAPFQLRRQRHLIPPGGPVAATNTLAANPDGHLIVTDDFLRHLLQRPEIAPIAESCATELVLHAKLLAAPRQAVAADALQALRDKDAADNYRVWLRFRDRLLAAPTLEAAYLALFEGRASMWRRCWCNELTQILLRHVLGDDASAMQARVAEMLFARRKSRCSRTVQ